MTITSIVHVLGATGAGKTTILDHAAALSNRVGLVQVGKIFRERYPPEYFQGQSNPKHTADEALQIYKEGVEACLADEKRLILVDGQPRDVAQVAICLSAWEFHDQVKEVDFLMVHANHEVREARLRAERSGTNLDLAMARLNNDYRGLYDVMVQMQLLAEFSPWVIDTSDPSFNLDHFCLDLLREYGITPLS